jgi:hypothetical protein
MVAETDSVEQNYNTDELVVKKLLISYKTEGPKRRPEGGEWEPIKIPHGIWPISQNQPKSTTREIKRRLNRRGYTCLAMA